MSFTPRTRLVNPRLGTYFGIFASALTGLVLLMLILEQLGAADATLRASMLLGPIALYAAIGLAGYTQDPLEYFAAGRRVPAAYAGLGLAITAMGATGIAALTGCFFLIGFDALCIGLGGLAGFVLMAILLAPFLRKFGAFTIPSYLGRRFESRTLRLVAAGLLSVPLLLVIAAELRMGAMAVAWLTTLSVGSMTSLLAFGLVLSLALGGMRSLTWSSVAEAIAGLLALIVPVAIVAVLVSNLPLPQLTYGPVMRSLYRQEIVQSMGELTAQAWLFKLPGEGISALAKRFASPFGEVGQSGFVFATLSIMTGVAAAPWLLPRVATTPGVYESRKSLGWATFFFGVIVLTATAVACYMRDYVMDAVAEGSSGQMPVWLQRLVSLGVADPGDQPGRLGLSSLGFARDGILLGLPTAADLPVVFTYLAAAGVIAAALAAAGAATVALGNILAEDIVGGLSWEPAAPGPRLMLARVLLGAAAVLGCVMTLAAPTDPLKLLLWAFALTGSCAFPVLVLSIWWKRVNSYGALAGAVTGFCVAVLAILASEAQWLSLASPLAAVYAVPASVAAIVAVSYLTPAPSRHVLELVNDIRIPGGEILYDREMRIARLRQRKRS